MFSVVVFLFPFCVIISQLKEAESGIYLPTDGPSVWTKTYLAMVPEKEIGSKDAGYLYIMSSESTTTDAWLNAKPRQIHQNITSGETARVKLPKQVIITQGSSKKRLSGFSVVTPGDLGVYFRDRWTFFQMRELNQLLNQYTVISYNNAANPMLSVVGICFGADFTKLTISFPDGVNVSNVLGPVTSDVEVNGQTAVLKKLFYRSSLKLESNEDLTGTIIKSSHRIAIIAGAMSIDPSNRYVYIDHMPTRYAANNYIVFGLPGISGNDTFRIVATSSKAEVSIDSDRTINLASKGDFQDVSFSRGSFHIVVATSKVGIAIFLQNGGPRKTDMMNLHPTYISKTSKYQFSIPSISSDVNFKHYLVVTTESSGQASMVLNGQALPPETVWSSISGTGHVGGYVPLVETAQPQIIATTNGVYFNAYLMGYGDDATYGSALEGIDTPQENTDDLQFYSNKTFCERSDRTGNYISKGTQSKDNVLTSMSGGIQVIY